MRDRILSLPSLHPQEEKHLFWKACVDKDPASRQKILEAFLKMALAVAVRGARKQEQAEEDLLGVTTEALCEALDRYEYKPEFNGPRFSVFARKRMSGAVLNFYRDTKTLVRAATTKRARELLYHPEEASTPEEVALTEHQQHGELAIHLPRTTGHPLAIGDTIVDDAAKSPEQLMIEEEERASSEAFCSNVEGYLALISTNHERLCWAKFVETGNESPGMAGKTRGEGADAVRRVRERLLDWAVRRGLQQ